MFQKFTYLVSLLYIFTIIAFGDSANMYVVSNGIFVLLLLLIILYILSTSPKVPIKVFLMIPFSIFCFLSILWSYDRSASQVRAITVLRLVILFVTLGLFIYKTNTTSKYIRGIAVCGVGALIYVIRMYGFSGLSNAMQEKSRVGVDIINANALAIFLAIAMIILLFNYIRQKNILYLLPIIPLIFLVALTGSKKGLLDLVIGFVLIIILSQKDSNGVKKYLKIFTILGLACIAVYFLWRLPFFAVVRERLELMITFLQGSTSRVDYSTLQRKLMIEYGLNQFIETPFSGIGIGATGYITNSAVGFNTYLHNNFVELLASVGIIGFIFYYFPILTLMSKCWKYRNVSDEALICFIILFVQLINDYGAVSYINKFTYILLAIAWAVVMKIEFGDEEKINEKTYI